MKANQHARSRRSMRTPDGGQMLLLAGFLLAAAAIIAVGTLQVIQRTQSEVFDAQRAPIIDLFLNARGRAVDYFGTVVAQDTAPTVQLRLDDYLASQYANARQLNLELNATLAGAGTIAPKTEFADHTFAGNYGYDASTEVCSHDHNAALGTGECYGDLPGSPLAYDGTDDGLITENGQVRAAIIYLEVQSERGLLFETVVVDVPAT